MTRRTVRKILTGVLTLLIGLLVLQALGYGIGFAFDPKSGVGEFGYEKPAVVNDLTVVLVGLVGVAMLGAAALLSLAAVLIWQGNPAGAYVALIVGGVYVAWGVRAFRAEWWWDAYFYAAAGASLVVLAGAVRWLGSRGSAAETG